MGKYLLAATAAAMLTAPASARNKSIYIGIEGGIIQPKALDGGAFVNIGQTFNPTDASAATRFDPLGFRYQVDFDEGFDPKLKRGYDVDAFLGYDLGMLRLEGELGYKEVKRKGFDVSDGVRFYLNSALHRGIAGIAPEVQPGPFPGISDEDFKSFDGKIKLKTAMVNALVDLGNENGLSIYAGGGGGRVWAAAVDDKDKALAYQLIAGARYAVSRNFDIGVKYRYFRTGNLNFDGGPLRIPGNDRVIPGRRQTDFSFVAITLSRIADIFPEFGGKYKSHSALVSLTYNFGRGDIPPSPAPLSLPLMAAPKSTQLVRTKE